jgi:ABC-type oligopeptide transport system ATPase subunit
MSTERNQSTGSSKVRTFEDKPAMRERVPLLVGLVGPSGGGKTFSALRLATGIQKATGGDIHFVDTEARRALHYADRFKFRHLAFGAPFSPLDYLAAIEHCIKKGAKTIIVDSMSHEHEGPGGVLEWHEAEHKKKGGGENTKFAAWAIPKAARRRLINSILQLEANFIFCFRAKEKIKLATKQERANGEDAIKPLGFMPIAGEEFVFEMTVNALLLPGAGGVPTWNPSGIGEHQMVKLPEQFRKLFLEKQQPLSEQLGEQMAIWAAGTAIEGGLLNELKDAIAIAGDTESLKLVWPRIQQVAKDKSLPPAQYNALVELFKDRKKEIDDAAEAYARGEVPADQEPKTSESESDDETTAATGTDD